MIPVTKPFLPPIEDYEKWIKKIWKRNWLTNSGPLVNELEIELKDYLDVNHLLYLTNGTLALQLAIKVLGLKGEIITTPFSFIASTSVISWEGCTPVFCDIDPETYNIDPAKIEAQITDQTSAILATHVYGNPCDVETIERIAKKHNLKVIFDAAHAFGVTHKSKSLYSYGDISTTSFHATKLYHSIEGGAVFTNDPKLVKKMAMMKNFGHAGPDRIEELGINAKNSEMHAAMGLCNLKYADEILHRREDLYRRYKNQLEEVDLSFQKITAHTSYNYSYLPILFKSEEMLLKVVKDLKSHMIYSRRYFYPTLDEAGFLGSVDHIPVAKDISKRILCLPLYHDLSEEEVDYVCRIVKRSMRYT